MPPEHFAPEVPAQVAEAARLTDYAVTARYPIYEIRLNGSWIEPGVWRINALQPKRQVAFADWDRRSSVREGGLGLLLPRLQSPGNGAERVSVHPNFILPPENRPGPEEYDLAVADATNVLRWAEHLIGYLTET